MITLFLMLTSMNHFYPVLDPKMMNQIQRDPEEPKPCFGLVEDQEDGSQKCLPRRCYIEERKQTCYDLPKKG